MKDKIISLENISEDDSIDENKRTYHELSINSKPSMSKYSIITNHDKNKLNYDEEEMNLYFKESMRKIFRIGFPTTLFFLCLYLQQTICLSFIGKKYNNQDMIIAIGIVNLYINCTLLCFVIGLISGLDTLLANALGGNNMYLFGLYIHRARLITYIFSFILCIFHYMFGLTILEFFNIEKETLKYCESFLILSLVYALLDVQFGINFRILSVLDKPMICVVILFITVALHPLWCYLFINVMDKSVTGAGWALVLSQFLNTSISTIYMHIYKSVPAEAYFCINKDCFKGWWAYIKFTTPSTMMLCAEWLAFEVQAIFAIKISKEDYSIYIFISNIASLMFTICHGFGMAATVLIGEYIAKGMIKYSKAIALYCFLLAEITMSVLIIIIIIFRESILEVFVDDKSLLDKGKPLVIVLAIGEIFDATQSVMGSIYRGLGKQFQASVIAFIQFYIVQILFTWILAFQMNMGVMGIWLSILLGNLLTTIVYVFFFTKFDFGKINLETKERLENDQNLISNEDESK